MNDLPLDILMELYGEDFAFPTYSDEYLNNIIKKYDKNSKGIPKKPKIYNFRKTDPNAPDKGLEP
jgi:hypothetical protein